MHKAMFWEAEKDGRVKCGLCRFRCSIAEGKRGLCGVRQNVQGTLYSLVYGRSVAENVDPIEKKPLFHYHPGSLSYSMATVGCNFHCLHCQNHQIAQWPQVDDSIPGQKVTPEGLVAAALNAGCRSIAYTYTEPTIYFEYAYDTARLAKAAGLGNVFVSNGYITTEALETIAPYLDAANIDLKGFSEEFYRKVTGASLQGVLETLKDYRRLGIWLEVTTLVIPGHNDSDHDLKGIARFIGQELGPEVPWHVSAFFPTFRMKDVSPTPAATLHRAKRHGMEAGLHYVYTGNLPGDDSEKTRCPQCGKVVIDRHGYRLREKHIRAGHCEFCRAPIAGVGLDA